jgi:hypothetical protein
MNKAARLMPSGPALGALLPPRGAIFTSLLRKLKPTPSRRTSQIISVGSAPSGEPCFPHQGSPGTGSCVLGCEGPVPESQRDTRSPVPGPGPGLRGHRHQNLGVCPRSRSPPHPVDALPRRYRVAGADVAMHYLRELLEEFVGKPGLVSEIMKRAVTRG